MGEREGRMGTDEHGKMKLEVEGDSEIALGVAVLINETRELTKELADLWFEGLPPVSDDPFALLREYQALGARAYRMVYGNE